ncbi:MAG TPA: hydrogenase, partial [Psychromonas hadalis]|nr:hydrogenase [Psychromonas hadalis]
DWHFSIAYLFMALFITRLIWGVIGSNTAQFHHFVKSPQTAFHYLKSTLLGKKEEEPIGHNPAGAYMVVAMFLIIATQFITGLFADDSIFTVGPLAHLVSGDLSASLTEIHHLNFKILLTLIAVHVLTIFVYLFVKKINLITPMITGYKQVEKVAGVKLKRGLIAWIIFLVVAVLVYFELAFEVVPYLF